MFPSHKASGRGKCCWEEPGAGGQGPRAPGSASWKTEHSCSRSISSRKDARPPRILRGLSGSRDQEAPPSRPGPLLCSPGKLLFSLSLCRQWQRVCWEGQNTAPEGVLFSMNQNHLQGLLKYRLLGPRLRVSDSVDLGRAWEFAFWQGPRCCWFRDHPWGPLLCTTYSQVETQQTTQGQLWSLTSASGCFSPRIQRPYKQWGWVSAHCPPGWLFSWVRVETSHEGSLDNVKSRGQH